MMRLGRKAALAGSAVGVLVLSGCGIAGAQFHPGIGATVGDQSISQSRIDDLAHNYCAAYRSRLRGQGQIVPLSFLKTGITEQLIRRDAADQLADEYHVSKGSKAYLEAVSQTRSSTSTLDKKVAAAVVELETSEPFIDAVLTEVGGVELLKQGNTGGTTQQQKAAGEKVLDRWLATHTIDVDPSFGLVYHDGKPSTGDTDLSFALSASARAGQAASPNQTYAKTLPSTQVCG